MSAAVLLIPFLVLRFGLMGILCRSSLDRASHFAPMERGTRGAFWVYQLSTAGLFVGMFFENIHIQSLGFGAGLGLYLLGLGLLAAAVAAFCSPSQTGISTKGIYRFSRNPMYVAYDLIFLGCATLAKSWLLLGLTACFILSGHWIIRAEERWCAARFGEEYQAYYKRVRRYF